MKYFIRVNRRGEIEKVWTGIPVMLIVYILLGIFIALAALLANVKATKTAEAFSVYSSDYKSLLFEKIEIDGGKYLIFEAAMRSEKNALFYDKFLRSLKSFAGNELCLYLELPFKYYFINKENIETDSKSRIRPMYLDKKLLKSVKTRDFYVDYYFGECVK